MDKKQIEYQQFFEEFKKLKAEFYAHNHNDIVPAAKGDRSFVLNTRFLKVGHTATTNPAIQLAIISTDPKNPSDGSIWFDGTYLHIQISGANYSFDTTLITTTSTSTTTTTTSSSTSIT